MVISILGTEPYGSIWYDVGSIMNVPNHQPFGVSNHRAFIPKVKSFRYQSFVGKMCGILKF
jgi:hypothetical protein